MNVLILSASLYLTDNKPAGEGIIAYEIIKRLSKKCNLTVLAPNIDLIEKPNCEFYEIGKYKFFPAPDEFTYKFNWWKYSVNVYLKCRKLLTKKHFDIFHFMMPVNFNQSFSLFFKKPFIIGPVFYPWLEDEYGENFQFPDQPTFFNKIQYRLIRLNNKITKKLFNKFLYNADKIVLTLESVKKFLPQEFHNKTIEIPVGVDSEYFKPLQNKEKKEEIILLSTVYLVRRKGLHYLIDALKIVKEKGITNFKLNIVGSGPDEFFFRQKVINSNLSDNVNFIGFLPHNQTLDFYQNADIYCHPALGEPFGLSIVEAMATELPVILFNCGGAPEVISEKNKKILVEPKNINDLANKIIKLIKEEEYRKYIGKKNREKVIEKYDWEIIANNYYNLYKTFL